MRHHHPHSRPVARPSLVWIVGSVLSGCIANAEYRFDYHPGTSSDVGEGDTVLVVLPHDNRPDVVSGDEPPSYVGELRNGFGIPFTVNTRGKRPFARVVAEAVARDLEAAGFRVVGDPLPAGPGLSERIGRAGARKALEVTINEFDADTFFDSSVEWDFVATVYDERGEVIATDRSAGNGELDGSLWNPKRAASRRVPPFLFDRLHRLIGENPTIVAALSQ